MWNLFIIAKYKRKEELYKILTWLFQRKFFCTIKLVLFIIRFTKKIFLLWTPHNACKVNETRRNLTAFDTFFYISKMASHISLVFAFFANMFYFVCFHIVKHFRRYLDDLNGFKRKNSCQISYLNYRKFECLLQILKFRFIEW